MKYAIYKPNGKVDTVPFSKERMIFDTYSEALEVYNSGYYSKDYYIGAYVPSRKKKSSPAPFGL